ncbi:putative effector protein/Endonuclease [Ceratobasidium theobromae]|uniref:Putative effector protein/Endonuclease n=1 Tax=Ceratobasidium theobromae TaxID=1582974 RepID=A0A5N5Q9E1_9AGAM|nr:putative effector protein/Endonuclease [Ceratobasidium theobromae]
MLRFSSLLLVISALCFHLAHGAPQLLPRFNWAKGAMWGGPHGTWFDDSGVLAKFGSPRLASITLRGDKRLDGISYTVFDDSNNGSKNFQHGGSGGKEVKFDLWSDEYITQFTICTDKHGGRTRVFSFGFSTNKPNRKIFVGSRSGNCIDRKTSTNMRLIGFFGQKGNEIDALGFVSKYV